MSAGTPLFRPALQCDSSSLPCPPFPQRDTRSAPRRQSYTLGPPPRASPEDLQALCVSRKGTEKPSVEDAGPCALLPPSPVGAAPEGHALGLSCPTTRNCLFRERRPDRQHSGARAVGSPGAGPGPAPTSRAAVSRGPSFLSSWWVMGPWDIGPLLQPHVLLRNRSLKINEDNCFLK